MLCFWFKVFVFWNLISFSLKTFLFAGCAGCVIFLIIIIIFTEYDQFIVQYGSVSLLCSFHNMVLLPSGLFSTNFGTYKVIPLLTVSLYPHFLAYVKVQLIAQSYLFMYCSFVSIGHVDMMCSVVSSNCLQSAYVCKSFVA